MWMPHIAPYLRYITRHDILHSSQPNMDAVRFNTCVRHVLFTINNIPQEEKDWPDLFKQPIDHRIKYAIWQLEAAPTTGHLHLQGYMEFNTTVRRVNILSFLDHGLTADLRVRQGRSHDRRWCIAYCSPSKSTERTENDTTYRRGPWEYNPTDIPTTDKKARKSVNNQFTEVREMIMNTPNFHMFDLMDTHPEIVAKYSRFIEKCQEEKRWKEAIAEGTWPHKLYRWQSDLIRILEGTPDDRQIMWYWESKGKTGKSTFAEYISLKEKAFYCRGGKTADVARMMINHINRVNGQNRICFFDFTRSGKEFVNYDNLEQIKSGKIVSTKYDSTCLTIKRQHVVCFANWPPLRERLSEDRWSIKEIDSHQLEIIQEEDGSRADQTRNDDEQENFSDEEEADSSACNQDSVSTGGPEPPQEGGDTNQQGVPSGTNPESEMSQSLPPILLPFRTGEQERSRLLDKRGRSPARERQHTDGGRESSDLHNQDRRLSLRQKISDLRNNNPFKRAAICNTCKFAPCVCDINTSKDKVQSRMTDFM
jgi:hypothetical protein